MLGLVRTYVSSRIAAVATACALSGLPSVARLEAPGPEHHCTCAGAAEQACSCVRCRAAGTHSRAAGERSPPCHGKVPGRPAPGPLRDPAGPCWSGSCGTPDPAALSPLALQPFTLPGAAKLAVPAAAGRVTSAPAEALERSVSPETPPPRAA